MVKAYGCLVIETSRMLQLSRQLHNLIVRELRVNQTSEADAKTELVARVKRIIEKSCFLFEDFVVEQGVSTLLFLHTPLFLREICPKISNPSSSMMATLDCTS